MKKNIDNVEKRPLLAYQNAGVMEISKDHLKQVNGGYYSGNLGATDNSCSETVTYSSNGGTDASISCTQTW